MTDLLFIEMLRKTRNPTIGDLTHLMKLIADGDLVCVDAIRDWLMRQDREYRLTVLNDLSEAEAEAQHDDRQRDGYPATDYAAECIRMAGRGHLLAGGAR